MDSGMLICAVGILATDLVAVYPELTLSCLADAGFWSAVSLYRRFYKFFFCCCFDDATGSYCLPICWLLELLT